MDLGITIITIICVAICAMPFILTIRSRKKRERKMFESIKELSKRHNCDITQHEICGNYAIGIDDNKEFVFFELTANETTNHHVVDLSTINNCIVERKNSKNQTIASLDLKLISNNKNKPDIVLEFYNVDLSYQPNGEIESVEKWNKLINKRLGLNK